MTDDRSDVDAAAGWDELYDRMSEELYPDHKSQAIMEFTKERLQSFYLKNPKVMRPAVDAIQYGKKLQENTYYPAALIFFVSAVEILLKATLLKPIVFGLIHNESLSEIIVKNTLGQAGFTRYESLLSKIFQELSNIELSKVSREGSTKPLLAECRDIQDIRNNIIHKGASCFENDAEHSRRVAVAVYDLIVRKVLFSINLEVGEEGSIGPPLFQRLYL